MAHGSRITLMMPEAAMERSTKDLEPDVQRTLDELYWDSTTTVKVLAERFGISTTRCRVWSRP